MCSGGTTTLTVNATGGTGNYVYTLSDGINNTGPQDNNQFTVAAGSYTVTVADDNGCLFTTETIQLDDGTGSCGAIAFGKNNEKQSDNIKVSTKNNELPVQLFPNPSSTEFTVVVHANKIERVEIIVMDIGGKKVYQVKGSSNDKYIFGKAFASGQYIVHLNCGKLSKTFNIIKGK